MRQMNKMSKQIRNRLIISSISALLPILLIVLLELPATYAWIHEHFEIETEPVVLRYLILVLLELFILWKIGVYTRFFKSDTFKHNYFIGKTDERNELINMKTNKYTIRFIIYILCGAAIICSFFNLYLFFVVGGILLIALISYIGTYIYFSRKY